MQQQLRHSFLRGQLTKAHAFSFGGSSCDFPAGADLRIQLGSASAATVGLNVWSKSLMTASAILCMCAIACLCSCAVIDAEQSDGTKRPKFRILALTAALFAGPMMPFTRAIRGAIGRACISIFCASGYSKRLITSINRRTRVDPGFCHPSSSFPPLTACALALPLFCESRSIKLHEEMLWVTEDLSAARANEIASLPSPAR